MVKVKICGITRLGDARTACEAGADALGFVFAKSPRRVSLEQARKIAAALGPWVTKVGVFVNTPVPRIKRIMDACGLDVVQLHGDEKAGVSRSLRAHGYPVIKAFRVGQKLPKAALKNYPADAFLLDTASKSVYGGTGRSFDWKLLRSLLTDKPVIVSGGLRSENVKSLLKGFKPFAVDVSSGVESSPGKKDPKLVRTFLKNAKKAR